MCLATSSTQNTSNTTTSTTATITSTTSTPPTPTVLETARWADLGEAAKIDKLNAMARKRSSENTLAPSDPDWMMHELVRQGKPVFKHRSMALLYLYWGLTAYGLLTAPSLAFALGAFLVSYLYIEAYGAVLHVNLDNPAFLHLPVLWEACLEFQFHHVIPNEIWYVFFSSGFLRFLHPLTYPLYLPTSTPPFLPPRLLFPLLSSLSSIHPPTHPSTALPPP